MNSSRNSVINIADILLLSGKFNIEKADLAREIGTGVINDTYLVESSSTNEKYILQKLHKIFSFDLIYDFQAVTVHLEKKGILTPKLIYTDEGLPGHDTGSEIWRMMKFIPGRTVSKTNSNLAESAGKHLGEFHGALVGFDYKFKFKIPGFHDIESNIDKLKKTVSDYRQSEKYGQLEVLCDFVFEEYEKAHNDLSHLPERVVHGDPKIGNFIFDISNDSALCLVDLDTVSVDKSVTDLGDAIRSWCHVKRGDSSQFDTEILEAFLGGYFPASDFLTNNEISAIIDGIQLVTLDLSARYITDAFKEKYFKYDSSKYSSLYEQNRLKAANLINFFRETQKNIKQISEIIDGCSSN